MPDVQIAGSGVAGILAGEKARVEERAAREEPPAEPGVPVSGFSIVKNATLLDYPIEAALRSILPLCDELVVNVGESEDDTAERVESMAPEAETRGVELRPLWRDWGREWKRTTAVHSEETNRALDACSHDWAFYVQADEVAHEDDLPDVREALARAAVDRRVEGLVFDYLHFYGSPEWVLWGRRMYRREVRLVRRSSGVRSVAGAQGFRVDGRKPRVTPAGARIFHYGYAKRREGLTRRRRLAARYIGREESEVERFEFRRHPGIRRFDGRHPRAIRGWIEERDWNFDPAALKPPELTPYELKVRVSDAIERWTGRRIFESRNYELMDRGR